MLNNFRTGAFFVLLFLITGPTGFSQQIEKVITLPAGDKGSPITINSPIGNIRLIQAIPDSSIFGYVQKGMGNRLVLAGPKKSITEDLQAYIQEQYKEQFQPGGAALLIIIKDIRINERTFAMKERAYIHFLADSWISLNNDGKYLYTSTLDTIFKTGGMDVTASHGKNIAKSLNALLSKASDNYSAEATATPLSYEEVVGLARKRLDVPILREENYKPGLYATYNEFLQNNPSIDTYRTETSKKTGIRFYTAYGGESEKEVNPWGLSKDGELYVYHDKNLVPIERSQNSFVISAYVEARKRRNQSVLIGALVGGMTGAIITSATGSGTYVYIPVTGQSRGMLLTDIPALGKEQPEPSHLDFETGKLYF
ncbi:MAG: hypothetical protein QM594_18460 [Niabella sp.]